MSLIENKVFRLAFWTLTAAGTAVAIRAAAKQWKPQAKEKAPMLERSVIINLPATQVAEALGARGLTQQMSGERGGVSWTMRVEDYDAKARTRLVAVLSPGSGGFLADSAIAHLVTTELRNMKALLETGEIATIAGQSEGERSFIGGKIAEITTIARRRLDELAKRQLAEGNT